MDYTMWRLTRSSCDLKKLQVLPYLSPNRPKPQEWITCVKETELFSSDFLGWFIYHLQGSPVKRKATRQEQAGKIRGVSVLHSI